MGNDSSTVLSACQRWASNPLLKVANRKSRKFLGHARVRKFPPKWCTTLSQNSPKRQTSFYTILCTIFKPLTVVFYRPILTIFSDF
jgi:hypothetical protein